MTVGDDNAGASGRTSHQVRLTRYGEVARALSLMSDRRLRDLVEAATVLGSGIGGTSMLAQAEGNPVFVKCVALTDLERRPEHVMSTANLFDLPVWCQYGVGSPSFGVWRELAAHAMTTSWVIAGRSGSFPLLYHWRLLDRPSASLPLTDELADVDRAVEYWHGSAAVQRRIEAIVDSSATVALFVEYQPTLLPDWLAAQVEAGPAATDAAIAGVEQRLRADVAFMNGAGLFHFDAHLGNILTDGHQLYLADFGLATSPHFELSEAEAEFLVANATHDAAHTITRFVDWIVTNVVGVGDWMERDAFIRRWLDDDRPTGLRLSVSTLIDRYAPIAVVVNDFYRQLHLEDRRTPYPAHEIKRALVAAGFPDGVAPR